MLIGKADRAIAKSEPGHRASPKRLTLAKRLNGESPKRKLSSEAKIFLDRSFGPVIESLRDELSFGRTVRLGYMSESCTN
jgi:hypothetical protein